MVFTSPDPPAAMSDVSSVTRMISPPDLSATSPSIPPSTLVLPFASLMSVVDVAAPNHIK